MGKQPKPSRAMSAAGNFLIQSQTLRVCTSSAPRRAWGFGAWSAYLLTDMTVNFSGGGRVSLVSRIALARAARHERRTAATCDANS
eukprot:scaffold95256_cov31-Tisochrysis_lutea.AAC.4